MSMSFLFSVWRPLKPIKSWPLAICDSRTVRQSDLVPSDLVRRRFVGETFYAKSNPEHRWYYLSEQQPDEVTMLKIYDSHERIGARCMSDLPTFIPNLPGPQPYPTCFEYFVVN